MRHLVTASCKEGCVLLDFKVDFALLLNDEFDGAPITDANVLFLHDGRIVTPLRKREGFYVFLGLGQPEIALKISRPHYHSVFKRVIKSGLDPGNPVEWVRLRRAYSDVFSDCDWLHGRAPPGAEVLAFSKEELKLQIGEEQNRLTLLGQTAGRLLGRRFALTEKNPETFLLTQSPAPGVYLSDKALDAPRGFAQSAIRAYLSKSGSDGCYHIPIEHGQSEKISGTAYYDRGKEQWVFASATARS
jgi:hypothetical protein